MRNPRRALIPERHEQGKTTKHGHDGARHLQRLMATNDVLTG
jgi:hypothetical protein